MREVKRDPLLTKEQNITKLQRKGEAKEGYIFYDLLALVVCFFMFFIFRKWLAGWQIQPRPKKLRWGG